jgi:surface protein
MRYALGLNNKALSFNSKTLGIDESLPILPEDSIRLLYKPGVIPTFSKGTAVQVSQEPNIWDLTYYAPVVGWASLLQGHEDLVEVLGANSSRITSLFYMFTGCTSLRQVALFDTSNVTDMQEMFSKCSSLTSIPLFDTSNVTKMGGMFDRCSSLTTVPLFDTSNVTAMDRMFSKCSSLTSIPLFDTSNVTTMLSMFSGCTSLTSIPLFDTSKVTNVNSMFSGCYNVESGALALYNQMSTQAIPPESHTRTFYNCGRDTVTGAAELAQIPEDWKKL